MLLAFAEFLFFGTLTGAFVLLFLSLVARKAVQSRQDWVDERLYSIGGNYETVTNGSSLLKDETRDAEGNVHRDLRLRQTGRRVKGTEEPKTATRKTHWELAAEVFAGAIDGTWAKKPAAATISRGSFHLEQSYADPTTFNGQWIGFDAGKGQQGHGDYVWIRKRDQSLIERLRKLVQK